MPVNARPVEPAQHREQIRRRLGEVAGTAEPQHLGETRRGVWAKGEQSFAGRASIASRRSGSEGA